MLHIRDTCTICIIIHSSHFNPHLFIHTYILSIPSVNSVRKLIRIKIADDNDLEQARAALKTAVIFFKELQDISTNTNRSIFNILSEHM